MNLQAASPMFDVAGGLVIAAIVLGAFSAGIRLVTDQEMVWGPIAKLIGALLICASLVAVYWLVFVRVGLLPWPPPPR